MTVKTSNIINKTIGILACLVGVLSIISSAYYFYEYHFTAKLWLYMIPDHKLAVALILGIIACCTGYLLIRSQKTVYRFCSLISIGLILFHWLFYI